MEDERGLFFLNDLKQLTRLMGILVHLTIYEAIRKKYIQKNDWTSLSPRQQRQFIGDCAAIWILGLMTNDIILNPQRNTRNRINNYLKSLQAYTRNLAEFLSLFCGTSGQD